MMDCPGVIQPTVTVQWPEHGDYLTKGIVNFFKNGYHVDAGVTFGGTCLKVHRLILAIFLPTFKNNANTVEVTTTASAAAAVSNLTTALNLDYVADSVEDVRALIEFVYTGQATVSEDRVDRLGRLAEDLSFDGLSAAIAGHRYRSNILEPDCQMDPVDICNAVLVKEDSRDSQGCDAERSNGDGGDGGGDMTTSNAPATDCDRGMPTTTQYANLINICDIKKEPDRESSTWTSLTALELPTGTDDSTLFDDTPCGPGDDDLDDHHHQHHHHHHAHHHTQPHHHSELRVVRPTPLAMDSEISLYNGSSRRSSGHDDGDAETARSAEGATATVAAAAAVVTEGGDEEEGTSASNRHLQAETFEESASPEAIDYSATGVCGGDEQQSDDRLPTPCMLCGVEFDTKLDLRIHYSVCHPQSKLYMFECEHCDFFTVEQTLMIRHIPSCRKKIAAATAAGVAAAAAIATATATKATPTNADRLSTGTAAAAAATVAALPPPPPSAIKYSSKTKRYAAFACDLCGKYFANRLNVVRHVLSVHEGQRPFHCSFCPKEFKRKSHLQRHVEVMHEPPDGQDHKCFLCGKDYTTRTKLLKHARRVHKVKQLDIIDGGGAVSVVGGNAAAAVALANSIKQEPGQQHGHHSSRDESSNSTS